MLHHVIFLINSIYFALYSLSSLILAYKATMSINYFTFSKSLTAILVAVNLINEIAKSTRHQEKKLVQTTFVLDLDKWNLDFIVFQSETKKLRSISIQRNCTVFHSGHKGKKTTVKRWSMKLTLKFLINWFYFSHDILLERKHEKVCWFLKFFVDLKKTVMISNLCRKKLCIVLGKDDIV